MVHVRVDFTLRTLLSPMNCEFRCTGLAEIPRALTVARFSRMNVSLTQFLPGFRGVGGGKGWRKDRGGGGKGWRKDTNKNGMRSMRKMSGLVSP